MGMQDSQAYRNTSRNPTSHGSTSGARFNFISPFPTRI